MDSKLDFRFMIFSKMDIKVIMSKNSEIKTIIKPLKEIKPLPDAPKKILFIKPSSLGDIFHALPAFYLLKASCLNSCIWARVMVWGTKAAP